MAGSDVKLVGIRPCPYVNRAQIALNLKSVEHEFIEVNPYTDRDMLVKLNPVHKKIPVLIHEEKSVCESLIVVQYIDEVWTNGTAILPYDPYDRAIALFWASYIEEKWSPLLGELRKAEGEEEKAKVMEKIGQGMALLEEAFLKCSKGKAFFGGDSIGYVDIALGGFLGWIKATEILAGRKILDREKTAGLVGWSERFLLDKAVKDVIMEPEKLAEIYQRFQAAKAN
nr:glutathione S-transferase U17-like [Ipomoea batatas]